MRITLDQSLFNVQSQAEGIALVKLFNDVLHDTHPHSLLTDPPYSQGGDNGPIDAWIRSRSLEEADAYQTALVNGLLLGAGTLTQSASDTVQPRRWHLPGSLVVRVERRSDSDWKQRILTIRDAVDLLGEPLHVVMENQRTEPAFVRMLAGPTHGARLKSRFSEPRHVQIVHGAGGENAKWLEPLTDAPLSSTYWRRLLRTWVLFDKDTGDTDALHLSHDAIRLLELCKKIASLHGDGLSWVCLLRREIESYVPDSGLRQEALPAHQNFINRIIGWRAHPQHAPFAWAIDLKKGLCGDLLKKVPEADRRAIVKRQRSPNGNELKSPWSTFGSADIVNLSNGFLDGDRLGKAIRADPAPPWSVDVPAEYDRGPSDQVPRAMFVQSLFDRM